MRKMTVTVKVRLLIKADDDIMLGNIIDEMDYSFKDTTGKATIEDTEIFDYEVEDSR